jgi:hypothetical protein
MALLISPRSRKKPAITPAPRARKTPSAPMTPTGGSSPPGCVARGLDPLPPDPQTVGLYLAACMEGEVSAGARNIGGISAGTVEICRSRASSGSPSWR